MQLGTRWAVGAAIPAAVPAVLHAAIRDAEAALSDEARSSAWTLTFLEGRGIAELDAGIEIAELEDGTVATTSF